MTYINIQGLDKAKVLQKLYNAAQPVGLGRLHYIPGDLSLKDAQKLCKYSLTFDYVAGRVIKVNLSTDWINVRLYDRDNGAGAASRALNLPMVDLPMVDEK